MNAAQKRGCLKSEVNPQSFTVIFFLTDNLLRWFCILQHPLSISFDLIALYFPLFLFGFNLVSTSLHLSSYLLLCIFLQFFQLFH